MISYVPISKLKILIHCHNNPIIFFVNTIILKPIADIYRLYIIPFQIKNQKTSRFIFRHIITTGISRYYLIFIKTNSIIIMDTITIHIWE